MSGHAGPASAAVQRGRMPGGPYPGLRPFLPHEEILLFGRERQVRQVIDKLRQTQLVTVIGGSGSGKSSLVLAGAVPELRSFGIPGTGDYWLPLVCTPGTNASQGDREQLRNTPITRLARKFAALLRSRGSPEADNARLAQIAQRLREELGFSQLVDLYTDELKPKQGPDPNEARFLLVIDQFEEIFHPTTRQSEDAKLLVERVIDHFFSPHPRCYIVLTMRSEHLNDCAGFLKLPDAINKSSYLVRRLDSHELHDVITLPAERMLRLRNLADDGTARLPDEVTFDPAVPARLLRDVRAISDDPDHLPLLQHALARTWQAATKRVKDRLDLPDRILPEDLAMAARGAADVALDDDLNVLRASVEHWAEAAYLRHTPEHQRQLDLLLPRLGVRDPNTGMYSQQRIDVAECAKLLGPGKTSHDLKALVADGFLGEVNYLFWDEDDEGGAKDGQAEDGSYQPPTTLKVSHESLIRGWERLRRVIDAQAERFEEFVELLHKCERWSRAQRAEHLLLEQGDLFRFTDAKLDDVLVDPSQRQAWFGRLGATAAYDKLGTQQDAVQDFVAASVARQKRIAVDASRLRRLMWTAGLGLLLLVPPAAHITFIQTPQYQRSQLLMKSSIQTMRDVPMRQPGVHSQEQALERLLTAAEDLDRAREGRSGFRQRVNGFVMAYLVHLQFFEDRVALFNQVAAVTDSSVNASLRTLLVSSVWRMPAWPEVPVVSTPAVLVGDVQCGRISQGGSLFKRAGSVPRWMFVPRPGETAGAEALDEESREAQLYTAQVDKDTNKCELMQALRPSIGFERAERPEFALDQQLRYLWLIDNDPLAKTATLFELDSELLDRKSGKRRTRTELRVQINEPSDVDRLRDTIAGDTNWASPAGVAAPATLLPTVRTTAGRAMKVGKEGWRVIDSGAQVMADHEKPLFEPLAKAEPGSTCARLVEILHKRDPQDVIKSLALQKSETPAHCFMVTMRKAEAALLSTMSLRVFAMPSARDLETAETQASLAFVPRFSRALMKGGAAQDGEWAVGKGKFDGWIRGQFMSLQDKEYDVALPWSTCALYRLGHEVLGNTTKNAEVCKVPGLVQQGVNGSAPSS